MRVLTVVLLCFFLLVTSKVKKYPFKSRIGREFMKRQGLKGDDECDGCKDNCSHWDDCGYVGVKNSGAFVAKACVSGTIVSDDYHFCCSTGGFDVGQTEYLQLPCGSEDITLIGEEDVFIDSWSTAGEENYPYGNVTKCYEIYGTTLDNHWKQINCSNSKSIY